jgi:signal peptidase I
MRTFFERRKLRKELQELLNHAAAFQAMREDVLSADELARLEEATAAARYARSAGDCGVLRAASEKLTGVLNVLMPPKPLASWRNNFEVLVVALSVAMAFRAYFYQPFKIPTGSMQPTLYGIQSQEVNAPGPFDRLPLKVVKWLGTGAWYREVRVTVGGEVHLVQDDSKPGFAALRVGGRNYYVPTDAVRDRRAVRVGRDGRVPSGGVLWSGVVTAGDFVFVNRWRWHFFRPRRGEVMVFSTQGIAGLPPGTHYIKRMCGIPNETLAVRPPDLLINGQPVYEPRAIGRLARREKLADWAPPYAGYAVIGDAAAEAPHPIRNPGDSVQLGDNEYFAMGDNTHNSRDSRYWGKVPARNLLGPATVVYWPLASRRWGWID